MYINITDRPSSRHNVTDVFLEAWQDDMVQLENLAEQLDVLVDFFRDDGGTLNGIRGIMNEAIEAQSAIDTTVCAMRLMAEPIPLDLMSDTIERWKECLRVWERAVDIVKHIYRQYTEQFLFWIQSKCVLWICGDIIAGS